MATRAPIPTPPGLPVVGHLHQIVRSGLVGHLLTVSRTMPEGIFKLRFGSRVSLFVTDPDLVAELSDETRFRKMPGPGLRVVRKFAGDGLFTAFSEEPNWGKAHRILLPAFSQRSMRGYFDMIVEVCDQLVAKWTRAAGTDVLVADDMTRLTLDSIAIAGFGHRFNSFEREELDSFLIALGRSLSEALNTITRLPIQQRFAKKAVAQYEADIAEMNALVDGIIADRRVNPTDGRDLLNLMLTAVDPETGEGLDDLNIRYQVLTFLIAGHETTSGMLTFAFAYLLRNPAVLAQAYAEVDRVLPGDVRPDYAQVAKLEVIERILKEALRLWPTAPSFSVAPFEDQVIGGRWTMRKDRPINVFAPGLHRSPAAWDDPEEFDIDRWRPEAEAARHPHAYKPFGNGERACIGRQFAMVEAKIALAMLLRSFTIGDPHSYKLRIKETLSIKPDDFWMRIRLRQPHERLDLAPVADTADTAVGAVAGSGRQFAVLYGSSLGTARDIAEEIAERARVDGFDVVVRSMDESLKGGAGPQDPVVFKDRVIVLVTATYNGRAPDSAVETERALDAGAFDDADWSGARVAVLGIGNSQWPNYQSFPKRIADAVEKAGATVIVPRSEADGQGDFDGAVAAFVRDLWKALGAAAEPAAAAALSLTPIDAADTRARALPEHAQRLEIVANEEMIRPADGLWDFAKEPPRPSTRLIRVRLPEGQVYHTGDHVAVYARNRPDLVDRAVARLGLDPAGQVRVDAQGGRFRHLPLGQTVTVRQLLRDFVELSDAASRRAVAALGAATRCPDTMRKLAALEAEYDAAVAGKRVTLLDLLDAHPAAEATLEQLVDWSPAIQPRFYSIASSPSVSPDVADLIVGTMAAPAWSGLGEHRGFASSYMQDVGAGDHVFGYVRRPNPPFAPPADAGVPMILIGPGTGVAPLRGFLQERSVQKAAGEDVATSLLFFGCRHPDHDWLCRDEMERWQADGVADLHLAFSAVDAHPWKFVQDALWAEQEKVWRALEAGASIFLCGDGKFMAPAVRDTLIRIQMQQVGDEHAQGSAWLETLIADGRFHQDVFGFGK
ncbi:reductase [Sphingomonas sp. Leaf412]|uniref:bifunctional cytochrome P450/NADPH--P450 reductase n=1 Tax=Sphingomonas sp. Leaf412 TaxID=1736370 RepID=UPI0006FE52E3|nr:cytochrome P450 [Sphingomonas sp. Leaf412]KQT32407.1 reductase [Sphingomonas sp. Leaf412]